MFHTGLCLRGGKAGVSEEVDWMASAHARNDERGDVASGLSLRGGASADAAIQKWAALNRAHKTLEHHFATCFVEFNS